MQPSPEVAPRRPQPALVDAATLRHAALAALRKLAPAHLVKSPVMAIVMLGTLLAGVSLAFVQGQGILFPDWSKPTKGTFEAPAAELGKKVRETQPWSITTVASSIEARRSRASRCPSSAR